jgi:hypothetical protein
MNLLKVNYVKSKMDSEGDACIIIFLAYIGFCACMSSLSAFEPLDKFLQNLV